MSKSRLRRASVLASIVVGLALSSAAGAQAANNPGTGDTGFFTFRPSAVAGTQINVASGNALVRTRDVADTDGNYHVVVDRAYNSLVSDTFSIISPRWRFDVGPPTKLAVQNNGDALVTGPSGYRLLFAKQADGSFKAPAGFDGSLAATSSGWTLNRTSQGDQFGFNGSGQLSWTKDRQARDFTVQGTSAAGRDVLSSYGTNSGRRVNLSYTGDSLVREMDDPSSGHHHYGYTNGKLTSYRSPVGAETTYHYAANGYLDKITEPGGTTVELATTSGGKVHSVTTKLPGAVGQTTGFVYTRRSYKTDVTASDGVRRTYAYDDDWRVTRQYNPDVTPTVTASGALFDRADDYTNGQESLGTTVTATEPDGAGIDRLAVEEVGGAELGHTDLACTTTAFDRICPTEAAGSFSTNLTALNEGAHELRAIARDDEGHVGGSQPWTVLIDKTPPAAPTEFEVEAYDGPTGTALVTWLPGLDPDIAQDVPGSQVEKSQYRVRRGGSWSAWTMTEEDGFDLANAVTGEHVDVEARSIDRVGNVGPTAAATLTIAQPADEADGDPTGTGDHDLIVSARRSDGDGGYEPVRNTLLVAENSDRTITVRTGEDGKATFPKIESGNYIVRTVYEDAGGETVAITGAVDQALTYTVDGAVQARNSDSSPVQITGDYRIWCATGKYETLQTDHAGLLMCREWAQDAQLALFLERRLFDHAGQQDSTRANAFRHMVWNALMVKTVTDEYEASDERYPRGIASALVFSTDVYEYNARFNPATLYEARASAMDRHNNRVGHGYMSRRTPEKFGGKRIPDFGICKRIRRLVGSVQQLSYKPNSSAFSRTFNRYRPVFYRKLDSAGYTVKLRPQTATFDPCGPLKPGRSS